jgi:hypothetical protein
MVNFSMGGHGRFDPVPVVPVPVVPVPVVPVMGVVTPFMLVKPRRRPQQTAATPKVHKPLS